MDQMLKTILSSPKTIHFVGIGGSGMYPIVQILHAQGHRITGSDVNDGAIIRSERQLGIPVQLIQKEENVHGADLVIYSAAIREDNPERQEAVKLGIPCIERSIMLGYLSTCYPRSICIAGTHGKTSTTGMTVQILEMGGFDPAAVIGGKLPLIKGYGKSGGKDTIVIEACEYHNTFLELKPDTAVLLNVDDDHLEFFKSMENLKKAFRQFCSQATGAVLYNGDDLHSRQVVAGLPLPLLSFGLGDECDLQAVNLYEHKPAYWAFTVRQNGRELGEIKLSAPGKHSVYNALAAYGAAVRAGASHQQCADGLASFSGTGRRFEVLGTVNGFTVADDYAHHPTEIKATLSAAKEMDYQQVWAVFQPYTFSRTQLLLDEFAEALPLADHVVMTAIMGGRERAEDYTITTQALADKIPGSLWFETQQETARYILQNAQPGDLVITLGCGDIYKCAHMILENEPPL